MVTFQACTFGESLGLVAPYYNLALVFIAIILFLKLFSLADKKLYMKPWYFLFFSVMVYVIEEILTVMEAKGLVLSPLVFPLLETVIITSFIYMLLLQKEHIK